MHEIQIFNHEEFGEIRTIEIDGQIYFVGTDVAKALQYKKPNNAIQRHVDEDDKMLLSKKFCHEFLMPQNRALENIPNRGLTIINESGLYSLVLASKLPAAKKFKHWVTSEVLPTIRKTGSYNPNPSKLEYNPYIYIENVNVKKIINQGEIKMEQKNNSYNPQGVKRIHVYKDRNGTVLAEKHITKLPDGEKKTYWYAVDPKTGRKTTGLNGMKMPLYHAEKLCTSTSPLVWFAEGEKDVETLENCFHFTATCTSGGGRQSGWNADLYNQDLHGKAIMILTDNDETGTAYGEFIAKNVHPIAESVMIVPAKRIWNECPEKGDISDIVQALGKDKTKQLLTDAIAKTKHYTPKAVKKIEKSKNRTLRKRKILLSDYDVDGTGSLTIENLTAYLDQKGYTVTYDEILRDYIFTGFQRESQEHLKENALDLIYNELQFELARCNSTKIAKFLNIIATRNKVNPIRTMIENTAWDGKDRLEEIFRQWVVHRFAYNPSCLYTSNHR